MNASLARNNVNNYFKTKKLKTIKNFQEILSKIEQESANGRTRLYIDSILPNELEADLETLNFKIFKDLDNVKTCIRW